ncbi:MAG: type II toxin-antitoxin system HicB family antitoxin [Candidatus Omnitrophota bacterium]|nr:type II toxin-antitoxin system HicB family antitoxin [Candidatus Omnitrophota bacterium]
MRLKIVLEKGEDKYIVASVPSLPGCHSQGKTEKEAIRNIKEAILLYLETDPENIHSDASHKILRLAI